MLPVAVEYELMLVGLRGSGSTLSDIIALCRRFRAEVISRAREVLIIEVSGSRETLDEALRLLPSEAISHVCRSGPVQLEPRRARTFGGFASTEVQREEPLS